MKKLPTLYKKTSTGASQFWEIGVDKNVIKTRWGQIDGKVQETSDVVKEGKNEGRSNATTPAEQALSEAESLWEKKLKKGYVKDLEAAEAGKVDSIIEGGIFPMLAQKFSDHGEKLKYPCLVQPKFDGHRCIAMFDSKGDVTLWTRSRKPILSMVHIQKELKGLGFKNLTLDGELYNHDLADAFEQLTSFIRDEKVKPGADIVQYHVYDVIGAINCTKQSERADWLANNLKKGKHVVPVRTELANDEDEMMTLFEDFLRDGYEGAMARNRDGFYVNKRSYDLLKIKQFDDAEFVVVGVEEGRGKLAGHAGAFICKTEAGTEFKAKLMGAIADLKQYHEKPKLAVGRWLTVKYQGITKKSGVPRFPVAVRFRDDV